MPNDSNSAESERNNSDDMSQANPEAMLESLYLAEETASGPAKPEGGDGEGSQGEPSEGSQDAPNGAPTPSADGGEPRSQGEGAEQPEGGEENGAQGGEGADEPQGESDELAESNPFLKSARGWQKRIDKLTARNKAKDDEIERLKSEIELLKSGRTTPEKKAANPVDNLADESSLEEYAAKVRSERDSLLAMLSSPDPDFEIGGQVYSREQLAAYLKNLNSDLDERLPERRNILAQKRKIEDAKAKNEELIASVFPDFKEGSAEDSWINEQLNDPLFEANKKALMHYAWRGLMSVKIAEKFKDKRAENSARKPNPAPVLSVPEPVSARRAPKLAISRDGSIDMNFAAQNLFD